MKSQMLIYIILYGKKEMSMPVTNFYRVAKEALPQMIHAYKEQFLNIIQFKIACMFELDTLEEKIEIDDFSSIFIASNVSKAIEKADSVYVLGKSANELLALILNKNPLNECFQWLQITYYNNHRQQ